MSPMNSQKYLLKLPSRIKPHTAKKLLGTDSKLSRKGQQMQRERPVNSRADGVEVGG